MRLLDLNSLLPDKPIETTKDVEKSNLHLPDDLDGIDKEMLQRYIPEEDDQITFYKEPPKLEQFADFKG